MDQARRRKARERRQTEFSQRKESQTLKDMRMIDLKYLLMNTTPTLRGDIRSPTCISLLRCRPSRSPPARSLSAVPSHLVFLLRKDDRRAPWATLEPTILHIQYLRYWDGRRPVLISLGSDNFIMSFRRSRPSYQTPLTSTKTIELPSNLLQGRPSSRYREMNSAPSGPHTITPRPNLEPIKPREHNMMVEEKHKSRKNVLYKRLSDIKNRNEELEKYSYSKLLSKMVILDGQDPSLHSLDPDDRHRVSSQYSCLRGKLLNMDYQDEKGEEGRKGISSEFASTTTRLFKRMYVPSEKMGASFFSGDEGAQKYIYINGKKTECRRIHNYYSSQNYKTSYGKAFGKTHHSFKAP